MEHVVVVNPCVFVLVKLSTFMITVNRNSTRTYHVAWGDSCEFVELLDHFSGGSRCSETRGGRTPDPKAIISYTPKDSHLIETEGTEIYCGFADVVL